MPHNVQQKKYAPSTLYGLNMFIVQFTVYCVQQSTWYCHNLTECLECLLSHSLQFKKMHNAHQSVHCTLQQTSLHFWYIVHQCVNNVCFVLLQRYLLLNSVKFNIDVTIWQNNKYNLKIGLATNKHACYIITFNSKYNLFKISSFLQFFSIRSSVVLFHGYMFLQTW